MTVANCFSFWLHSFCHTHIFVLLCPCFADPEFRAAQFCRQDFFDALEHSEAARQWKTFALHLKWKKRSGETVNAFSQTTIDDIEREARFSNPCLFAVISRWTDMDRQHCLGSLYDVLVSMRLGAVADKLYEEYCKRRR